MSGWTILTVRGKRADEYKYVEKESSDRAPATKNLAAMFKDDKRVRQGLVEVRGYDHVYAILNCGRYDFGFAEEFTKDYEDHIDDIAVLGWNDTTDTGTCRYYPRPGSKRYTFEYEEEDSHKGDRACAAVYAMKGIQADNPFHEWRRYDNTDRFINEGRKLE